MARLLIQSSPVACAAARLRRDRDTPVALTRSTASVRSASHWGKSCLGGTVCGSFLAVLLVGPTKSKAYRGWPQLKRQNRDHGPRAPSVTFGAGIAYIIISIFPAVLTLLQRQPPAPYQLVAPLFVRYRRAPVVDSPGTPPMTGRSSSCGRQVCGAGEHDRGEKKRPH